MQLIPCCSVHSIIKGLLNPHSQKLCTSYTLLFSKKSYKKAQYTSVPSSVQELDILLQFETTTYI